MENWFDISEKISVKSSAQSPHELFRHFFFKNVCQAHYKGVSTPYTLLTQAFQGYLDAEELHRFLTRDEQSLLLDRQQKEEGQTLFYWFPKRQTLVNVSVHEEQIYIDLESINREFFDKISKFIDSKLGHVPPQGQVMMLAQDGGFYLTSIGKISCPLQRVNYTEEQLKVYDAIVTDLKCSNPLGRLTLLEGSPGTGKSFFIRGLITESPGLFVFVPAALSGTLTGPEITPVLLSYREREVPVVLLMEDADATLVTRQLDNVSKLSELLNISDGILGDLADVRILATTNAKKVEIDEAILRPGRLAYHLIFDNVSVDHARSIYVALTKKPTTKFKVKTTYSLADVYKMARDDGWVPKQNEPSFSGSRRALSRGLHFPHDAGF